MLSVNSAVAHQCQSSPAAEDESAVPLCANCSPILVTSVPFNPHAIMSVAKVSALKASRAERVNLSCRIKIATVLVLVVATSRSLDRSTAPKHSLSTKRTIQQCSPQSSLLFCCCTALHCTVAFDTNASTGRRSSTRAAFIVCILH